MCEPRQCSAQCNTMLFPYQCNCLCWKIAITRLHWILLCWMWQVPLAYYWESDHHGAPSCHCVFVCPVKTMWSIGDFVPHCWEEIVYCRCDGNRDGSAISDQNWIKNREAAASRFTLPRLNWQMNQRMNEPIFALLLFASLSFLDSFFPSGLLLRKNPSARLGMLSFNSMLPLKFRGTWMKSSNRI